MIEAGALALLVALGNFSMIVLAVISFWSLRVLIDVRDRVLVLETRFEDKVENV